METGLLTKQLGWGRNEIMGIGVRERRYWVNWVTEIAEMESKARQEAMERRARETAWARPR